MCIFSQPVESVTNTKIFARLAGDGWQHLVYQMNFRSQARNAIILPLPVTQPASESDGLTFVSLKNYEDFFADLERGFPIALPKSRVSRGLHPDALPDSVLEVQDVGDFVASFVPSLKDFSRLDPQFRIPQESWDQIPRYADYGFAVFQLKSHIGRPHPMAFRFQSRMATGEQDIFFPTVHIHDGEVHDREGFDHTLYLQAPQFDAACGNYQKRGYHVTDQATGYVRSVQTARNFCDTDKTQGIVSPDLLVHRLKKKGHFRNDDIVAHMDLSHARSFPLSNGQMSFLGMTSVAGVMGFRWLCERRNQLADERRQSTGH